MSHSPTNPFDTVTRIISESRLNPQLLADLERFRCNVTVMFTDIKGSTSYFEKHGDIAGLLMVHECNDLLKQCVALHKGRFIKTIGDAVMAMFETPSNGVRSAIEMQRSILEANSHKPEGDRVTIRVGLHYGTAIVKTSDLFGDAVNVASRVESHAQPEQIVISDAVHDEVVSAGEFRIRPLGRVELKGKAERRDLYEVEWKEVAPSTTQFAAHTIVMNTGAGFCPPTIKLQQLRQDGSVGEERVLKSGALVIGSEGADFLVSGDSLMAASHARISLEGGQVFVEDLSGGAGVYVRLMETRTLQEGDEIVTGNQHFSFHKQEHAVMTAAATGTRIVDMSRMLNEFLAELVAGSADGTKQRYALVDESVTWGRSKGTYVFPEDRFLSRTHARIYQRGEDFFLEDLDSRNGTYVRVRGKTLVSVGTRIRMGGQILRVTH
jgi:adenylate cyclase